jgi:hypothetical protein
MGSGGALGVAGTGTSGAGLARFGAPMGCWWWSQSGLTVACGGGRPSRIRSTPGRCPGGPGRGGGQRAQDRCGAAGEDPGAGGGRRGAMKARVGAAEQRCGLRCSAPKSGGLRCWAHDQDLVGTCAAMGPRTADHSDGGHQGQPTELGPPLAAAPGLVSAAAPTLVALPGVGVDTAGQLLVTAGDNPNGCAGGPPWRTGAAALRSRRPRAGPAATGVDFHHEKPRRPTRRGACCS